jgi:hypothetical protein
MFLRQLALWLGQVAVRRQQLARVRGLGQQVARPFRLVQKVNE